MLNAMYQANTQLAEYEEQINQQQLTLSDNYYFDTIRAGDGVSGRRVKLPQQQECLN